MVKQLYNTRFLVECDVMRTYNVRSWGGQTHTPQAGMKTPEALDIVVSELPNRNAGQRMGSSSNATYNNTYAMRSQRPLSLAYRFFSQLFIR